MLISRKRCHTEIYLVTYNGRLTGNHILPIKWQQRQWPWMNLKVIHRLQAFPNAIRRTFVQHFTGFQLTVCSHGSSALVEPLVYFSWRTPVNRSLRLWLLGHAAIVTPLHAIPKKTSYILTLLISWIWSWSAGLRTTIKHQTSEKSRLLNQNLAVDSCAD